MATIAAVHRNVKALDLKKESLQAVEDTSGLMLDLQKEQLFAGLDADEVPLHEYRSRAYAEFKLTLNPKGVTDLKLSGSFYDKMFFEISEENINLWSKDDKAGDLTVKYGNIWGLGKKRKSLWIQRAFWPLLKDRIQKVTKLQLT